MRYPHFLPENGSIGFISPSFGAATEPYRSAFLNARAKFEAMGYRCVTGPNAFVQEGVGISNTPEACAAEVNDFFTRKDTDILISLGGGELMCTILDEVDFPAIQTAPPKWFMGFSDNTNLTFLLPTLCDTAAVYGPNAPPSAWSPGTQPFSMPSIYSQANARHLKTIPAGSTPRSATKSTRCSPTIWTARPNSAAFVRMRTAT